MQSNFKAPELSDVYLDRLYLENRPVAGSMAIAYTNLTTVVFSNSIWTIGGVRDLLISCPQLKILQLSASICDSDWETCALDFPRLRQALCQYGRFLESLTIDARGALGYEDVREFVGAEEYFPLLGSLEELAGLRELRVPLVQLLDVPDIEIYFENNRETRLGHSWRSELSDRLLEEVLPDSIESVVLLDHRVTDDGSSIVLGY